jgi:DNA-binding GntR family transcriptional regulator
MSRGSGGAPASGPVGVPGATGTPRAHDARNQRKLVAVDADMPPRVAASVLAERMAAALVHREPGWRLPRRSALARRYNVSMAEIDTAIGELIQRSLIRRLPDGQLYRASPAEYLIPVEGVGGLTTRLDPMGGDIACRARHVSQRGAPQEVASALGLTGDSPVRVIRCVWAAGADPVAVSTAYVPEAIAASVPRQALASFEEMLHPIPGARSAEPGDSPAEPADIDDADVTPLPEEETDMSADPMDRMPGATSARAVDIELSPPQPAVARSLRLVPGQSAFSVTIRFDDPDTHTPVGLTVVILKPEFFRVVIETR